MNRSTRWDLLFDNAHEIISHARKQVEYDFNWSFGGGTAIMLQIDHRESHDVDIFIDDPQILAFLNPTTQNYALPMQTDDYDTDGSRMIKLYYEEIGEIDFICCADISETPSVLTNVRGIDTRLETPAEVIAKKVHYRGSRMQPRDMFDIAAVTEARGREYVIEALRACGHARCAAALKAVENFDADAATKLIAQLMYRPRLEHLVPVARTITAELLQDVLAT